MIPLRRIGLLAVISLAVCCIPACTTPPLDLPKAVASAPKPSEQPTIGQSAPTPAQADVIVTIEVSAYQLKVGDTISVTVRLQYNLPPQCSYPLYDVTLEQEPGQPQLLRYDTPKRLGPPGPNPAYYQLTAIATGTLQLRGVGYGEINCGNGWQWAYRNGTSADITITPATTWYLPVVMVG